jgi:hypothetical protein
MKKERTYKHAGCCFFVVVVVVVVVVVFSHFLFLSSIVISFVSFLLKKIQ